MFTVLGVRPGLLQFSSPSGQSGWISGLVPRSLGGQCFLFHQGPTRLPELFQTSSLANCTQLTSTICCRIHLDYFISKSLRSMLSYDKYTSTPKEILFLISSVAKITNNIIKNHPQYDNIFIIKWKTLKLSSILYYNCTHKDIKNCFPNKWTTSPKSVISLLVLVFKCYFWYILHCSKRFSLLTNWKQ